MADKTKSSAFGIAFSIANSDGGGRRHLEKIRSGRANFVVTTGVSPSADGDKGVALDL